ncbi:MAG: hypothetical protein AB1898_08900 [Acidobacteriota bacterium]
MAPRFFLLQLKEILVAEVTHIQGFMQLLMKPRNGLPWSQEDKSAILAHLRYLGKSLPILVVFSLPGGGLLLPLLAWFLDRRRQRERWRSSAGEPAHPDPARPDPPEGAAVSKAKQLPLPQTPKGVD